MRKIVYRGSHDLVSVPAHRLVDVEHGVPVEVPDHVADDLTGGGTSLIWLAVGAKGKPSATSAARTDTPEA
jgi:hypothetical protein